MDIVSVAAPKRRRRRKQEVDMDHPTNPTTDPLFVTEEPIEQPRPIEIDIRGSSEESAEIAANVESIVDTRVEPAPPAAVKSRDIGNWEYREWKGRDHWYNTKTHRSLFNEREVRRRRHE